MYINLINQKFVKLTFQHHQEFTKLVQYNSGVILKSEITYVHIPFRTATAQAAQEFFFFFFSGKEKFWEIHPLYKGYV